MQHLSFSISITILSWMIGLIVNEIIKNKSFYSKISNFNFIENKATNKLIGVGLVKWVIKNTFFKYFNQKIKLKGKIQINQLLLVRKEMTIAEIGHLVGFACVAIFALVMLVKGKYLLALIMMLVNVVMNLHPSLLQQENKRRIDRLIKIYD